jgi:protocatechuate 3,4-dioxygenase beta subunit
MGFTLSLAAQQPSQQQAAKPAELCTIEGIVLRAEDGAALKKARVSLTRAESVRRRGSVVTAITSAEGRFLMRDVPAGRYRLTVERSGYVQQEYGQRNTTQPGSILTLAEGQRLSDVTFRMLRAAVISGRVYDEEGEPVVGAQVQALRYLYFRGERRLAPEGNASTNDLGEYRIFGLEPGRYYLSAVPNRGMLLFGTAGRGGDVVFMTDDRTRVPGGPANEEEYAATYFPGTADAAQAAPLELKAGQELAGMDLSLVLQKTVRVRGRVFNAVTGQTGQGAAVMLIPRSRSARMFGMRDRGMVEEDGSFEIRGVAPGSYVLNAMWFHDDRPYSARQALEVGYSDVEGVTLTIAPGVDLPGRVSTEGSVDLQAGPIRVLARSEENLPMFAGGMGPVSSTGEFVLRNIGPGSYRVEVAGLPPGAYVKEARLGSQDVLQHGLSMGDGRAPGTLEITLSAAGAAVEGLVLNSDSLPVAGGTVVLVPARDLRERSDLFKAATTDQYGRYAIRGIAPGEYKLFCWEEAESGAWQDPEFLRLYEDKGVTVNFSEGAVRAAELKLLAAN